MRAPTRRALRVPFAVSAASVLAGLALSLVPADATPGGVTPVPSGNVQRSSGSPFTLTKTLTRSSVSYTHLTLPTILRV